MSPCTFRTVFHRRVVVSTALLSSTSCSRFGQNLLEQEHQTTIRTAENWMQHAYRTCCSNYRCSRFITAVEIEGDTATCTSCAISTCTVCKGAGHVGECPHDTALHAVVDLANTENWQRYYRCRSIVQLEVGCNHITYVQPLSSPNIN